MNNATQYEILHKETWEVFPVFNYEAGEETVTVHFTDGTPVIFINKDSLGQLENESYLIREIGTHSQPDGTGTVEAGIPTE